MNSQMPTSYLLRNGWPKFDFQELQNSDINMSASMNYNNLYYGELNFGNAHINHFLCEGSETMVHWTSTTVAIAVAATASVHGPSKP